MGEDELDEDLTDEDLENPDLVNDEEPIDEESPLDDVEEPVTSEMTPEMDDVEPVTSETNVETEDTTVSHVNNVEIPLDSDKAKNVNDLITEMENELINYTSSEDIGNDPTKSQTVNELFNKLSILKTMINYEPTPEDVVGDIDDNLKSLGNLVKDNRLDEFKENFDELKDNLLTSLDSIADPSDVKETIEVENCENCDEPKVEIEEKIDVEYPEYEASDFNSDDIEETDLEDGDADHFKVISDDNVVKEDNLDVVDVTPYDGSEDDFSVKETEVVDPILDMEDNTEEFNVEETLAPKKKYKPKFKKTK